MMALILLHQFAGNYGCAGLYEVAQAEQARFNAVLGMGLAGCVLLGAATPLVLGGLVWCFAAERTIPNLGSHAAVLSLWGLILLGAGRTHGVDAWLMPRRGWHWLERIYLLAVDRSPAPVAAVRLALIIGFWGLCLNAMGYHLLDPHWMRGSSLRLLYTSPYWTDLYWIGQRLQDQAPTLFWWASLGVLIVQSCWETLLLPLLFVKGGRWLCGAYGWFFFGLCLATVNLGHLPCYEVVLWLMIFPPGEFFGSKSAAVEIPSTTTVPRGRWAVAVVALAVVVMAISVALHNPVLPRFARRWVPSTGPTRSVLNGVCSAFGQGPVDVFNGRDIGRIGETVLVLAETDADGGIRRVVPYMDSEGGRLAFFRSDLLYYGFSIPWHGTYTGSKFDDANRDANAVHAHFLARRFCLLDACVRRATGPRTYKALLFSRKLVGPPEDCAWSPLQRRLEWSVEFDASEIAAARVHHGVAFVPPPGQQFARMRMRSTMAALRSLEQGATASR